MTSLFKKVSNGVLWVAFGTGAQVFLQFLLLVALSRLLTPSEFGQVTAALTVVSLSTIFSQMGVGQALVQSESVTVEHKRVAWTLSMLSGAFICSGIFYISDEIQSFYAIDGLGDLVRILAFVFPIVGFGVVSESSLQRSLRFKELMGARVTSYLFGYGLVSLVLAYAGLGASALAYGFLAQAFLFSSLVYIASSHSLRPSLRLGVLKGLVRFGSGLTLAKVGNYLATQGDYVIVGKLLGVTSLGVYSRAYQLLMLPTNLIGTVLEKVLFPTLSLIQEDKKQLQSVYEKGFALVALLTFPLMAFSIVFGDEIVKTILGSQWHDVVAPFQILIAVLFFRTAYKLNESLIKAAGRVFQLATIQWVYASAVVSFSIAGASWGLNGVSVGVGLSVLVNYFLTAHLLGRVIPVSWGQNMKLLVPGLATGGVVLCTSLLVKIIAHGDLVPLLMLVVGAGLSVISLGCLSYVFPNMFLGAEGVWLVKKLKRF
ncbi:lipopolysaccharide biosynthesis protein [Thauera aminoaromatica]|uniref:Polysaccharide biosynthesis protein n=1 Tax=Thauera aminoaromatica TaxID=164330 RepID=C4ZJE4_THASP|nr:lipopolysaccharide biosynthesis protein [Thauera aminoaromatica]ACK53877.1 polysaccharide biosynthesis protein [Thauera aminoaromatica]